MNKIIGISGYARSGKDTFYSRSALHLKSRKLDSVRYAFADALKEELDGLLKEYVGISAFSEKDKEKEIIRPLLVTYGTELRRKLNPNCWIEKIQDRVLSDAKQGKYVFITDVRFENEAQWIKNQGGKMVYIEREKTKPANSEEHRQNVLMKKYLDYKIYWETFGSDKLNLCDEHVLPFLSHLIHNEPKFEYVM